MKIIRDKGPFYYQGQSYKLRPALQLKGGNNRNHHNPPSITRWMLYYLVGSLKVRNMRVETNTTHPPSAPILP